MDIGTGKDFDDYFINSTEITRYLIDIIEPAEEYNLFLFRKDFYKAFTTINDKNKLPFLVGGTGMYLSAVLQNYRLETADFDSEEAKVLNTLSVEELRKKLFKLNQKLHNTTDLVDKNRIIKAIIINNIQPASEGDLTSIHHIVIGIAPNRELIKQRIKSRLKERLDNGMIDEVNSLLKDGIAHVRLQQFGLEYKFISKYLLNELNYNDMFQKLNSAINLFAKKQMTWFRKMEKEGIIINWIDQPSFDEAKKIIESEMTKD
jgi:tRNA dimethylallyltransferase